MLSFSEPLGKSLEAIGVATSQYLSDRLEYLGMSIEELGDACCLSIRTLKGYVNGRQLGNFYHFSLVLTACGGGYEDLLDAMHEPSCGGMPIFCKAGFVRANAFFRKTARRRSLQMRQRYWRAASGISHQSNENYHHWANLSQIVSMAYEFGVPLSWYLGEAAKQSKDYYLQVLFCRKRLSDDEFLIMDEADVDTLVRNAFRLNPYGTACHKAVPYGR